MRQPAAGGEEGIRTLVGLPPNGFQDRLVMTTSIPLHRVVCSTMISISQRRCFVKSFFKFCKKLLTKELKSAIINRNVTPRDGVTENVNDTTDFAAEAIMFPVCRGKERE